MSGSPREKSLVSPPFYRKYRMLISEDNDFTNHRLSDHLAVVEIRSGKLRFQLVHQGHQLKTSEKLMEALVAELTTQE